MKLKIEYIEEIHQILLAYFIQRGALYNFVCKKANNNIYSDIATKYDHMYKAHSIYDSILHHIADVKSKSLSEIYSPINFSDLQNEYGFYLGIPYHKIDLLCVQKQLNKSTLLIERYGSDKGFLRNIAVQHIQYIELCNTGWEIYENITTDFDRKIVKKVDLVNNYYSLYKGQNITDIENYFEFILSDSFYWFEFDCKPSIQYSVENKTIIVEYYLPNIDEIPNIKEKKVYKTSKPNELKYLSERELNKIYDDFIYAITLRSIAEIFHFDECNKVDTVMFNGMVEDRSKITGKLETTCILSIMVKKSQLEDVDFGYVDAKVLFKHLKGVSATKLHTLTAIAPIMEINRSDKRFVESHSVDVDSSTNLAAMDWEEFEHLIRELFEKEFNVSGGEVKVTQSSRDGGVDAIAFDPDPIRGGKIVIQAKRYTNTVGVSAVRDLYGTVMNEGANKGILVTTSDYGSDSYDFAKGKPITLLNGGHILYLLEKHGQKAHINITEAKEIFNSKK